MKPVVTALLAAGGITLWTLCAGVSLGPSSISGTGTSQSVRGRVSTGGGGAAPTLPPPGTSGATATQYVLAYTAANTSQCQVEVSTSPTYSPLVVALDASKFSGANMDGLSNAGSRTFVVGGRWIAQENAGPPSITVASGNARRAPYTAPNTSASYGLITVTHTGQPFVAGDNIMVTGMANPAYNSGWARVMTASAKSFTYWVTASGRDTSGGGTITRADRYSMALENNTAYYYRLGGAGNSCRASPATGTFTTMNWPNGDTWAENFPTDSTGHWETPSIPESHAASVSVIDPMTGTLTKPMSLWSDAGSILGSTYSSSGGGTHHCTLQADSKGFIHCYLGFNGGDVLYAVNETTGEVRYLGNMALQPGAGTGCAGADSPAPGISSVWATGNPNVYYGVCRGPAASSLAVYQATYTGNDAPVSGNTWITARATNLTTQLSTLIHDFDSTYNSALYHGVEGAFVDGNDLLISINRWNQGSPAWIVIYNLSSHKVVAATSSWANQISADCSGRLPTPCSGAAPRRWSGLHGQGDMGGTSQGWTGFGLTALSPGDATMGYFITTLNQPAGLNATDSTDTITVTSTVTGSYGSPGDPMSQDIPPDGNAYLDQALPGDIFQFEDTGREYVMVMARNSAASLKIARGCHSSGYPNWQWLCDGTGEATHASGANLAAINSESSDANPSYNAWNFVNDPHGQDVTQTNMIWDHYFMGGHGGAEIPWMMVEGNEIKGSSTWNTAFFRATRQYSISQGPPFAGVVSPCGGSACESYPHFFPAHPGVQQWFWDPRNYAGGPYSDTSAPVASGTGYAIYKYSFARGHNFSSFVPYFSVGGISKLTDISAPGSALPASSAGNNEFCIVTLAGECRPGSSPGQVYANLAAAPAECKAQENGIATGDWCLTDMMAAGHGVLQFGLTPANLLSAGPPPVYGMGNSRKLVLGMFQPPRGPFAHIQSLYDQRWVYWESCLADPYQNVENPNGGCVNEVYMARVPPQPPSDGPHGTDGTDRTSFENVTITVGAGSGGATHAVVRFGYEENEPAKSTTWPPTIHFYCTQYQGACYYQSGNFSNTVAANATSLSLSSAHTLQIGVPQRVLFYQVEYLNGSNHVLATDPMQVVAIP